MRLITGRYSERSCRDTSAERGVGATTGVGTGVGVGTGTVPKAGSGASEENVLQAAMESDSTSKLVWPAAGLATSMVGVASTADTEDGVSIEG